MSLAWLKWAKLEWSSFTARFDCEPLVTLRKFIGSNRCKSSNGSKRFERIEPVERFELNLHEAYSSDLYCVRVARFVRCE
jgi:hypothetical protein